MNDKKQNTKVVAAKKSTEKLQPKAKEELRAVLTYFEKYRPEKATN